MTRRSCIAIAAAIALLLAGSVRAQQIQPLPEELEGVGITEHPDARLPLDAVFTDESGTQVVLGDYFQSGRPVLLNLVYYSCPMLCTLVLNGMTEAMKPLDWTPGKEFEIVTVSFEARETPSLARIKKQNYLNDYGRPDAGPGWHFLVGGEESVRALTKTVGFGYRWVEEQNQYAHQAAIFVITPDGRISRYLYGVMFDPTTLRLSLVEAGKGKVGSPLDRIVLYCFHYDPNTGKYSIAANNIMRVGGVLTVFALGTVLTVLWTKDRRKRTSSEPTESQAS